MTAVSSHVLPDAEYEELCLRCINEGRTEDLECEEIPQRVLNSVLSKVIEKSKFLDASLLLLDLGAETRHLKTEVSLAFIRRLVKAKSVADIRACDFDIDKNTLTKIFKSGSHTPTIKAKLIALGAEVDERALTTVIKQVFKLTSKEGVEAISSRVETMSASQKELLLDQALTSELFDNCAFRRRTFAEYQLKGRLFYHVKRDNVQAVGRLVRLGVDVDAKDANEKSALFHATANKGTALCTLLIASGAKQEHEPHTVKLEKDWLLSTALSPRSQREVAYYLYITLPRLQEKATTVIKMSALTLINRHNKTLYLLPKNYEGFKVERSFKKATMALKIPLSAKLKPLHASKMVRLITHKDLPADEIEMCRQESVICKALQGLEGVWKVDDSFEERDRLVSFSHEGTPFVFMVERLTTFERVQVIKLYIKGLLNIHNKGIIHGDLNQTNCLVRRLSHDKLEAGWIDFGLSFDTKTTQPNAIMKCGFYGTIAATAPELLGVENFTGNLFKVEVYALGCMIYTSLYMPMFPWFEAIHGYFDMGKERKNYPADKGYILGSILHFMQTAASFHADPLKELALKMMRPDPKERITLQEALIEIENIK